MKEGGNCEGRWAGGAESTWRAVLAVTVGCIMNTCGRSRRKARETREARETKGRKGHSEQGRGCSILDTDAARGGQCEGGAVLASPPP